MTSTHTRVELAVSKATHTEIADKLKWAGYGHAIDGEVIDMHGLALTVDTSPPPLGSVLVDLNRLNALTERVKELVLAGSLDARSLAADVAQLLEAPARHG